jgi:signal transduction histidine kinase
VRRRILFAIVGVTAMATVVLTVPLTIINARREADLSRQELERIAQRTLAELPDNLSPRQTRIELPKVESRVKVGVYLPDGSLLAGNGPATADRITKAAHRLEASGVEGAWRILGLPVINNEHLAAIIRVAEPAAETTTRVRNDLLLFIAFDVAAVGIAALVGWFVSSRLARPVREIRDAAVRLGEGDFSIAPGPSGVDELDETAEALSDTAGRLEAMLARERAFSADASHQLRTPLAALRLTIETELLDPRPDQSAVLDEAIEEIDRLELTVSTLLDLARDRPHHRSQVQVDALLDDIRQRWAEPLADRGRRLRCESRGDATARVSRPVVEQILDVLVGNAVDHGSGEVAVVARMSGANLDVTVADQGRIDRDGSQLFTRRDPEASGHGVGLYLARSLAEAEGGRLVLTEHQPTTFRLILTG